MSQYSVLRKNVHKKRMETEGDDNTVIDVKNLDFWFSTSDGRKKQILYDVNLKVQKGNRVLLVGPNGAGKTTLLRILAGKHLTENREAVTILGKPAFFQTLGVSGISFLGNALWSRPVAFVGSNVTYEADIPAGEMMADLQKEFSERRDELVRILEIDLDWRLNQVSDGQRRRVQIMLGLLRPFKILLIDEFTVDLDVLARKELMEYLRNETIQRGGTILYCTHIFDGLDDWPTHSLFMSEGRIRELHPHPLPLPLFQMTMKFMLEARERRKQLPGKEVMLREEYGAEGYSHGRINPSTSLLAKNRMNDYRF